MYKVTTAGLWESQVLVLASAAPAACLGASAESQVAHLHLGSLAAPSWAVPVLPEAALLTVEAVSLSASLLVGAPAELAEPPSKMAACPLERVVPLSEVVGLPSELADPPSALAACPLAPPS